VDSVEISNSVFRSNTSGGGNYVNLYGGCIYASLNNYLGISNTVISSNSSREIGALCIDATTDGKGKVVLNQVKIDSNSQSTGNYVSAAFFRDIAQVEIVDSRISDNKGAGVWTKDVGNFQITGSLLDSNKTYHVYLNNPSGSNNRFLNNTFRKSQNKAIYLDNTSSNYVTNNTFVNNTGDVYLKNASAEFKNNIFTYDKFISDAFSRSSTEVPISSGGNIVKGSSFKNYFTKSNDINTRDPQLDRFGWHGGYTQTYSLSSKSDAIDLGGKDSIRYDQRGYVRDSLTDAGAFEFGALDPFIISVDTIIAQTDYCIGDSMKLEVRVTGMVDEYAWYKNGRLVTGQTSSVYRVDSVTSLDSASYKCIVSNAKNSDSTKLVQINVFEYPLVIASGADTICTGDSAALSVSGAENYTWRHNAGDSAHIWVSPMGTTTYSVQGESNGCVRFDSVVISVDTTPTVKITGKDTICVGDSVELIADGADSYTWHHASGDDAKRMEKPVQTTTYRVTGTTKSCSSSDSITVTVNPNPVLSVHNDTSICAGEHLWLWARGAQNFSWKPSVADSSYIKVQPNVTTSYEVTGITNGCSSSETIEVGVRPSPDVSILATDTALCDSGSVILSAKGANSYVWADGLGSASSVVVKPKVTTTYAVTGSKDGCTNMASRVVYVFTSPDPPIIKNNDVLETGFYSDYQWRWNGEDIQGATERTYEPYKNGDYTVRVTEENGCEGESTAKITIDDLVGVADPEGLKPRIYPNPNSGSFTLDLNGLGQVETITIYNGQGQKVYQRDQIDTILLELRLHDLSPGLYRLVVQGETQSVNTSFVLK
jgi:parallel beta-helix repeat protein